MLPYPREAIEQIILNEVMQGEGSYAVRMQAARIGVWLLLLERLCPAMQKPTVRRAVELLLEAECRVLPFVRDGDALICFLDSTRQQITDALFAVKEALAFVLQSSADWADPCTFPSKDAMLEELQIIVDMMTEHHEGFRKALKTNKSVGMLARVVRQMEEYLQRAYGAFLTPEERKELDRQLEQAKACLQEYAQLLPRDGDASHPIAEA